jgi:peptide-methionine (S)-S-oxide reductase
VGYAGGTKEQPTYRDLGDHTETVEVDYDPSVISYEELLMVFWRSHDPYSRPWSKQYSSIIFYHNVEQKELAVATREREAARSGRKIHTQIVPAGKFYRAEDYHQKYYLRMQSGPAKELRRSYPSEEEFVDSLIAARLNGYAAGHVALADIQREINDLSPAAGEDKKVPDFLNR